MEPRPPAAEPEPPLPRGPRQAGPGPGPEQEPGFWAPEAAEPAPGPPPWSQLEEGGCPDAEGPDEPPARREEEEEEEPRLRPVFDALDQDGDGFVRVEEFVQFATAYGAEQVKDLTKYLDPSGLGVISFEDFHRGIRAIKNGDPDSQLYDMGYTPEEEAPACPDEFDDFVTFED